VCLNFVRHFSEINRITCGWIIDGSVHFRRPIFRVGNFSGRFSRVRRPNFTKLGVDIRRSPTLAHCFSLGFIYLALFRNAGVSNKCWRSWNSNFAPKWSAGENLGFDHNWILTTLQPPQSCAASSCQISRQSANVRLSYWRLRTLPPCNFRGWNTFTGRFSGMRGPNFAKHGEDIGRSSLLNKFVSEFRYLAAFQMRVAQN